MKSNLKISLLIFLVIFLFSSIFISSFAAEKVYTFKYSNQQNPQHPRTVSMLWFKDEIEKRSDGRIKAEIYDSGVLGKEKELFEMLLTGAIQGYRGAFFEYLNPKFQLWMAPFMFHSYDEVMYFNHSDFAKQLCVDGSIKGAYIPAIGFTGGRNMICKVKQIERPEDLVGLKMRSPGQAPIIKFYKQMGAHPMEMASSDTYMALKTGVIDGMCNDAAFLETNKTYEVAPHFTWINYMVGADPLMVNMEWYQSLPDDLKTIFNEVSVEAMQYSDEMVSGQSDEFCEKLVAVCDSTVKVLEDPELVKAWSKAAEPLLQIYVDDGLFGMDDVKAVQSVLAEFRNK